MADQEVLAQVRALRGRVEVVLVDAASVSSLYLCDVRA
jgi:hypothetical protein